MRVSIALFLVFSWPAVAGGPDAIQVLIGSQHFGVEAPKASGDFEEFNPGVVAIWRDRLGALDVSAGAFRNSYGKVAPVVALSNDREVGPNTRLGWFLGVAHYGDDARFVNPEYEDHGLVPFGGVQLTHRNFFVQGAPLSDEDGGLGFVFGGGLYFDLK